MGAHGSKDGARGAMKEQNQIEQADEDGPDRGEQQESGAISDATVRIIVPTVVAASEEARYPKLDNSNDNNEAEQNGVSTAYMFINCHRCAGFYLSNVKRRRA